MPPAPFLQQWWRLKYYGCTFSLVGADVITYKFSHITVILKYLHWLKLSERCVSLTYNEPT